MQRMEGDMAEHATLTYSFDTSAAVAAMNDLTEAAERAAKAVREIGLASQQKVQVNITGDDWLVDMVKDVIDNIPDGPLRT